MFHNFQGHFSGVAVNKLRFFTNIAYSIDKDGRKKICKGPSQEVITGWAGFIFTGMNQMAMNVHFETMRKATIIPKTETL